MAVQHHEHQITDNRNSIAFLGNMFGELYIGERLHSSLELGWNTTIQAYRGIITTLEEEYS